MKILILILASLLLWALAFPFVLRTYARITTDKIIYGKRTGTEKYINRRIRVFVWTNNWITNNEEPDSQRIKRLVLMLEEKQKPNG